MNETRTRLRDWLDANDITLTELSGLTGYSVSFLSYAASGQRRVQPMVRLHIARAVGAPVQELFEPEPALSAVAS